MQYEYGLPFTINISIWIPLTYGSIDGYGQWAWSQPNRNRSRSRKLMRCPMVSPHVSDEKGSGHQFGESEIVINYVQLLVLAVGFRLKSHEGNPMLCYAIGIQKYVFHWFSISLPLVFPDLSSSSLVKKKTSALQKCHAKQLIVQKRQLLLDETPRFPTFRMSFARPGGWMSLRYSPYPQSHAALRFGGHGPKWLSPQNEWLVYCLNIFDQFWSDLQRINHFIVIVRPLARRTGADLDWFPLHPVCSDCLWFPSEIWPTKCGEVDHLHMKILTATTCIFSYQQALDWITHCQFNAKIQINLTIQTIGYRPQT